MQSTGKNRGWGFVAAAAFLGPAIAAGSAAALAVPPPAPTHLYWFETLPSFTDFALKRSNLQGGAVATLTVLDPLPTDLAIDSVGRKIYWAVNGESIQRANLDGTGVETIVFDDSHDPGDSIGPHSIALDPERGKLYWTDRSERIIRRANLDGSQVEDVVTTDKFAEDLRLDLTNDRVYWLDLDTGVNPPHGIFGIRRANLDGTNKTSVVGGFGFGPSNFALDPSRNALFWSQFVNDHIYRATLSGAAPQVLFDGAAGVRGPWEMDVDFQNGALYWSELISGAIRRSGPLGGALETLYVGGPIRSLALGVGVAEPATTALVASSGAWLFALARRAVRRRANVDWARRSPGPR